MRMHLYLSLHHDDPGAREILVLDLAVRTCRMVSNIFEFLRGASLSPYNGANKMQSSTPKLEEELHRFRILKLSPIGRSTLKNSR